MAPTPELHPARGRRICRRPRAGKPSSDSYTPQGDVGNASRKLCYIPKINANHAPQGDVGQDTLCQTPRKHRVKGLHPARGRKKHSKSKCVGTPKAASHPARGHEQPPRFTAQFCAAKRGGCFFVKFWAVPVFFRNFSNCGSFRSFYIRIRTVSHWKFLQKNGRNFSVSGVHLCRIPCYNGSKSFHGGQQLRLREFLPL